jgi:hypothetical protein
LVWCQAVVLDWRASWDCGLSNEEVDWQVKMSEKYGPASSKWPKEETEARETARKAESKK